MCFSLQCMVVNVTSCRLDVVYGVSVQLEHLRGVGLPLLVAADGEGVLRHLHQHEVPLLPLLPHRLPHRVHVPGVKQDFAGLLDELVHYHSRQFSFSGQLITDLTRRSNHSARSHQHLARSHPESARSHPRG